jgi:hypothetical protein
MPIEAIVEWGITGFIFLLLAFVCGLAMCIRPLPPPKDEPSEYYPAATDSQAILDAMNGLEACIDWRHGNTDSNLILDDIKWQLWKRAKTEYGIIPTFNQRMGRWEEFDGKFR